MTLNNKKIFVFDLDGVICTEERTFERPLATPNMDIIEKINLLYNYGHVVIIYTARTWAEYAVTKKWLEDNMVCYNELIMGKPQYDFWVDDRSIQPEEFLDGCFT